MTEPRTWTVELPAGMKLLSMNGRLHWSEQRSRGFQLKQAAWAVALKAKIPHLERARITVEYQPPDRRRRDADNICGASGKHAIDGIVAAKVLIDDESPRYVESVSYRVGPRHPAGRLVLIVTEVQEPYLEDSA